ncbi:F420 biosynthesis protein FbiB-like protein [Paenibacillus castaneae]|uniref:nitroreductase family protein n=1 Tax=Paenibacillus castaneae TaxID=474957 RepID=UPI000C9C3A4B|nr:nitroreductase [Paenibacillus castaneae]NIK77970.1 F420 biosynthesis protein FbiB-like protein [Paenibacillus castaneae]
MNVEEAIKTRRTIGRVKKDPVDRAIIERLIEAAVFAPSHHNTQPWSFIVMTGEGRARLAEGYARVSAAAVPELSGQPLEERLAKERSKAYRAPVIIAAVCVPSDNPRAVLEEELAAVQAAVQNLLLAAHANGLGAIWRSGDPMYHPLMRETLGLAEDAQLVGFIYLGYPDMTAPEPQRIPATAKTVWLE